MMQASSPPPEPLELPQDKPIRDLWIECWENERPAGKFLASAAIIASSSEVLAQLIQDCRRSEDGHRLIRLTAPYNAVDLLLIALQDDPSTIHRDFTSQQLIQTALLGRELKCDEYLDRALQNWSYHALVREPVPRVFSLAAMVVMAYILGDEAWFSKATKFVLLNYTGNFRALFEEQWRNTLPQWVSEELEARRADMRTTLRTGLMEARRDTWLVEGTPNLVRGLNTMLTADGYYSGTQALSQTISTIIRFRTVSRMELMLQGYDTSRESNLPVYLRKINKVVDRVEAMPQGLDLDKEDGWRRSRAATGRVSDLIDMGGG